MAINYERISKVIRTVNFEESCEIMRGHHVKYRPTFFDLWDIWRNGIDFCVHAKHGTDFRIKPQNPLNIILLVERTKCS